MYWAPDDPWGPESRAQVEPPVAVVTIKAIAPSPPPAPHVSFTGLAQIARLGPACCLGLIPIRSLSLAYDFGQPCENFVPHRQPHHHPTPPPGPPATCVDTAENSVADIGCPAGAVVSTVDFASFGTPGGSCAAGFTHGAKCDSKQSMAVVKAACVGKNKCTVDSTCDTFKEKLQGKGAFCWDTIKHLAVKVTGRPWDSGLQKLLSGSHTNHSLHEFGLRNVSPPLDNLLGRPNRKCRSPARRAQRASKPP